MPPAFAPLRTVTSQRNVPTMFESVFIRVIRVPTGRAAVPRSLMIPAAQQRRPTMFESVFIRVYPWLNHSPFPQILFDEQQVAQERQREQRREPAQAVAREQAQLLDLVNLRLRHALQPV